LQFQVILSTFRYFPKKRPSGGQGGSADFFLPLITPFKISEPIGNSFWEKSNSGKKTDREKNAVNSGHLAL
jgi:hypothetical protein